MMRLGFDPDRPLIAVSAFEGVASGEVFDWRARGMQPIDVLPLYQAGVIDHISPPPPQADPATSPAVERSPEAAAVSLDASKTRDASKTPKRAQRR